MKTKGREVEIFENENESKFEDPESDEFIECLKRELEGEDPGLYGLRFRVVDIRPEIAKKMVKRLHPDQRKVSRADYETIAEDIVRGKWKLTHQAGCIDANFRVIDLQHRLLACIEANKPIRVVLCMNENAEFLDPIDRARPRSIGVILRVSHQKQAAINGLRLLEGGGSSLVRRTRLTPSLAGELAERYKEELNAVLSIPCASRLNGGFIAACVWALPIDRGGVLEFAEQVATGEMLSRGEPAFAFRNWKTNQRAIDSWSLILATFNCISAVFRGASISGVHTSDVGYRFVCKEKEREGESSRPTRS